MSRKGLGARLGVWRTGRGRYVVLAVAAVLFVGLVTGYLTLTNGQGRGALSEKSGQKLYTCPMHPFIASDHPGTCSVCGMTLVEQGRRPSSNDPTCSLHTPGEVTLTPQEQVMANVSLTNVSKRDFSTEINVPGKVAWDERSLTRVSSRVAGRIERLHVSFTGASVKNGQPLLDIYAPELISAQNEYLVTLGGTKPAEDGAPSETDGMMSSLRDAARRRLANWGMSSKQIAELKRTRHPRRVVTITASASGVVTERLVTAGQYVNEGTPLFSLASSNRLWVIAEMFEQDVARIVPGAAVAITTEAVPGKPFRGTVAFIDPAVNPETRTLRVRINLDNSQGLLKPEMFVKVAIRGKASNGLAVPESAVLVSGDRSLVWVARKGGVFLPRVVTTGRKDNGYREIVSGVSLGETIAATGGFLIDSESQLNAARTGMGGGK